MAQFRNVSGRERMATVPRLRRVAAGDMLEVPTDVALNYCDQTPIWEPLDAEAKAAQDEFYLGCAVAAGVRIPTKAKAKAKAPEKPTDPEVTAQPEPPKEEDA